MASECTCEIKVRDGGWFFSWQISLNAIKCKCESDASEVLAFSIDFKQVPDKKMLSHQNGIQWAPRGKQRLPHSRLSPSCYSSTYYLDRHHWDLANSDLFGIYHSGCLSSLLFIILIAIVFAFVEAKRHDFATSLLWRSALLSCPVGISHGMYQHSSLKQH